LPIGEHWDDVRERAADCAIDTVDRFAPNFGRSIIARQIHTPLDLERKFGLTGGDIYHGKLTLNQLFSARPMLGHADYRSPIPRPVICADPVPIPAAALPGAPGTNAAREIWRDRRRGAPGMTKWRSPLSIRNTGSRIRGKNDTRHSGWQVPAPMLGFGAPRRGYE
jgi:phytoene dehydrogenase-like protein